MALSKKAKIILGAGAAIGVILLVKKSMASTEPSSANIPGASPRVSPAVSPGAQAVPPMIVPDYSPPPTPFSEVGQGGGTASGTSGAVLGYDTIQQGGYAPATGEVFTNE